MPKPFKYWKVEDLAGHWKGAIKIGPFGSQLRKEEMVEIGRKVYGQENVIAEDWSLGERRITESKFRSLQSCELQPGDVVVSMMGTVGKCSIFPTDVETGIMDSHLLRIQPNQNVIKRDFLARVLQAENIVGRQVAAKCHGSIMAGLSSGIVRSFEIPLPPINEQPIIVSILDTLDTTIRQTEAIIAKLQQMKQGVLHDLLTRGIGANGNLRPFAEEAPHLYKESPLGLIPKEWEVTPLEKCAYVTKLAGFEYTNYFDYAKGGEITVVRVLNIKAGTLDLTDIHKIPRSTSNLLPRSKLFAGDLVLSYVGTIGQVAIIPDDNKFHLAPNVAKISVNKSILEPKFLCLYLVSEYGKKRLINLATITSQPSISMSRVRQLLVPVPSLSEQNTAAKIIDSINNQLNIESEKHGKLTSKKSGLMDDILTGHVRVTPLLKDRTES